MLKSLKLFLFIIFFLTSCQYFQKSGNKVAIKRVIDGDTIEGYDGVIYRLIGIDTPERGRAHYENARQTLAQMICMYCDDNSGFPNRVDFDRLKFNTIQLIKGSSLEYITVNMEIKGKGKYGRTLVYISCREKSINEIMISGGFAISYKKYPHERMEKYNELEYEAKSNNKGFWDPLNRHGFNQR